MVRGGLVLVAGRGEGGADRGRGREEGTCSTGNGKETVYLFSRRGYGWAPPVAGELMWPLPYLPWVVVRQMVLHRPPVALQRSGVPLFGFALAKLYLSPVLKAASCDLRRDCSGLVIPGWPIDVSKEVNHKGKAVILLCLWLTFRSVVILFISSPKWRAPGVFHSFGNELVHSQLSQMFWLH